MRARRCRADEARSEAGFTFIEIMISVWLMGALMVTLVMAVLVMTRTGDINRQTASAEIELRHYAEAVRITTYVPCATSTTAGYGTPPGYAKGDTTAVASVVSVMYHDTTSTDPFLSTTSTNTVPASSPNSTCSQSAGVRDDGVQLITLQMKVGFISRTTTIIKRSPTVPGGS